MTGPNLQQLRKYLAVHTTKSSGANVLVSTLHRNFTKWCVQHGGDHGTIDAFKITMEYAGFTAVPLDLGGLGYRELYISNPHISPVNGDHLSSLGLAGLHLEMAAGHASSLAARTATDPALVGQYDTALANQIHARDAFRAELERVTGLPADLIERRLEL